MGTTTTADVPAGGVAIGAMTSQALADGAKNLWPLGESSGATAYDYASADDLTLASSATRGTAGPNSGDPTTATTFPGSAAVPAVTSAIAPGPGSFAAEVWFKTTTTSGGKLLGYGNSRTGDSSNYDRHLYMTNNGRLMFGVYPGGVQTVMTGTAYNDGVWHHAVVNLGASTGMELYVDGKRADAKPAVTTAQAFSGYWRVGGDNLNGWTNQPSSSKFAGSLQNVAIYPAPLTAAQVLQHYQVGTGTGTPNQAPVAAFTSTVSTLTVTVDGSGSSDADGTVASYAWAFGDGATATGAKPAPHTYAHAGDYAVTLTVTDNGGATNTVTRTVTATAANQAPVAAFTSTVSNLTVTVDGSGSSDADGTVASYAWAFGDGATATGAKPTPHTYANAGDYAVTLTVTDNGGATNTVTRTVTATAPNQPLAQDTFTRTVTTGFGTAETGGAWTFAGTGTTASVADGSGAVSVTAGKTARLTLAGVSSLNTEVTHTLWTEAMPTGGGRLPRHRRARHVGRLLPGPGQDPLHGRRDGAVLHARGDDRDGGRVGGDRPRAHLHARDEARGDRARHRGLAHHPAGQGLGGRSDRAGVLVRVGDRQHGRAAGGRVRRLLAVPVGLRHRGPGDPLRRPGRDEDRLSRSGTLVLAVGPTSRTRVPAVRPAPHTTATGWTP